MSIFEDEQKQERDRKGEERRFWTKLVIAAGLITCGFIVAAMAGCPVYNVWQQKLTGQAELSRAEGNRQIKIQEARAAEESAKHWAQAEIIRAGGVAQANKIIGSSLKDNEAYLRWLWIEGTKATKEKQLIYVPTEANLPILEANRFREKVPAKQP